MSDYREAVGQVGSGRGIVSFVDPDVVVFDGRSYLCDAKPLDRIAAVQELTGGGWARDEQGDHIAGWLVDTDGLLLLTDLALRAVVPERVSGREPMSLDADYRAVPLDAVFPGWGGDPYPAAWFSGIVTLFGAPFLSRGNEETRSRRVVIEVAEGEVTDFEIYDVGRPRPIEAILCRGVRPRALW